MNIYYDKDIDYAEIFFEKAENYGEDIAEGIVVFKNKNTHEVIGYAFEEASKAVFQFQDLSTKTKVAFLLKMTREIHGYTQEQITKKLDGISGRQYQRAEAGENISLDIIDYIRSALPEADFSKIFEVHPKKVS